MRPSVLADGKLGSRGWATGAFYDNVTVDGQPRHTLVYKMHERAQAIRGGCKKRKREIGGPRHRQELFS